jgi:hypothetical protein
MPQVSVLGSESIAPNSFFMSSGWMVVYLHPADNSPA